MKQYDYTFSAKHQRAIDAILKKYRSITTAEIIAIARERAINAVKADLEHAETIGCKPNGTTLYTERSYVFALFAEMRDRELTTNERLSILRILQTNYHESGKIAGIQSIDSSCNCDFCEKMHNSKNPMCVCRHCYAHAIEKRYNAVGLRHELNAFIMSQFVWSIDELKTLKLYTTYVRFNSDGDIINTIMSDNYHKIALAFPHINFGFWFKNVKPVSESVKTFGKLANMVYIYSDPMINGSKASRFIMTKYAFIDYVFTVYAGKRETLDAIAAGAANCNGKDCFACGYKCYAHAHTERNIAEIGRNIKL